MWNIFCMWFNLAFKVVEDLDKQIESSVPFYFYTSCYWLLILFVAALARDNKDCDCFAVFILTHGHEGGYVYGTEEKILISKLMKPLKDADVLAGKPKMVFIQVCRGTLSYLVITLFTRHA